MRGNARRIFHSCDCRREDDKIRLLRERHGPVLLRTVCWQGRTRAIRHRGPIRGIESVPLLVPPMTDASVRGAKEMSQVTKSTKSRPVYAAGDHERSLLERMHTAKPICS